MERTFTLEVDHLSLDYRLNSAWVNVLRDVVLTIAPGEIHGLVGESGSGKSTLALAMMGFLASNARVSSGNVRLGGESLFARPREAMQQVWGGLVALVPQDPLASLNPSYKVGEQIAEGLRTHLRLARKDAWKQAVEMLGRVRIDNPQVVAQKYPHQLSGGMQQRVTIAMALSTRPRLLILDEPTTALDVTTEAVILDLFRELIREEGASALYVSHNLGVIAQMCDRVTILYAGEVMATVPVRDLFRRPIHPYSTGLLASLPRPLPGQETRLPVIDGAAPSLDQRPTGCVFAPRCPIALERCHAEKPSLETTDEGYAVKCHRWREIDAAPNLLDLKPMEEPLALAQAASGEWVLEARGVSKRYGQGGMWKRMRDTSTVQAVDDVSIRVRERSTLGLVGESGSGKTSLARCIVGLETADTGEMELLSLPISNRLRERGIEVRRNLQMVFQNPNDTLNPYRSVGDTLSRTLRLLNRNGLSEADIQQSVIRLLESVRLPAEYASRFPAELSGGERQRVAIARAFAGEPALVLADEPTSALDVSVQAVILNLLKDLRAEKGASYIFISHDLRAVSYLADWLCVMYQGQVVEEGDSEQVFHPPWHPYTEALILAIPEVDPDKRTQTVHLPMDAPQAFSERHGCRFAGRCPRKLGAICEQEEPPWRDAGEGHRIRCHIPIDELIQMQTASVDVEA
ncbi:MAG: ABC transporter ATP-binding protein [Anaerolineae bacterium]|nr:ABC transporter ATP-binding protein [Anaerolineae bacterium]